MVETRIDDGTKSRTVVRLAMLAVLALIVCVSFAVVAEDVEAQAPGYKDITLYLHNATTSKQVGPIATLRYMDTVMGTDALNVTPQTATSIQDDWYLYPVLANATTIEGNVSVHVWGLRTARTGDNRQATISFNLYDIDENGAIVATIAADSVTYNMINDWKEYSLTDTSVAKYTVAKDHSLHLECVISGSASNYYQIAWGDSVYRSRLDIESADYVRVDEVQVLDDQGVPRITLETDAVSKDVTFRADITDPFGGYDIKWVNVTLVDPLGATLIDGDVMTKSSGFFNSWRSEYDYPWNYGGFEPGRYSLTVTAVDFSGYYYRFPTNPGDTTFGGHLESLTVYFWIGGLPEMVTVTVRDNLTRPLEGCTVDMVRDSGATDPAGNVTLFIINGTYTITVYWQDVVVYQGQVDISGPTFINVEAAVYDPEFIVVDDHGDPVEDAVAFFQHPNGTVLIDFWRTDDAGVFSLSRMAGGLYNISVLWLGVEVFDSGVAVAGQGPFTLDSWVYTLSVEVVDDRGDGLELAQVAITNTSTGILMDSKLTDLEGNMSSKLPIGSYDVDVYWRNSLVYNLTRDYLLNTSRTLVIVAYIYSINITAIDTDGVPLNNAKVVVSFPDDSQIQDFGITDNDGKVSSRLAPGYFKFRLYWREILVNTTPMVLITGHEEIVLVGSVYWVPVTVEDSQGVFLADALVSFMHDSGQGFGTTVTDPNGTTTFRLPVGSYGVDVVWLEATVHESTVQIDSNETLVLVVDVYYLGIQVTDSLDANLEGAVITISSTVSGRDLIAASTDADGGASFRLPLGTYALEVTWQGSPVLTTTVSVSSNDQIALKAAVFYPTFHATDSRDVDLASAQVMISNATTGRAMGTLVTDTTGQAQFRLPLGSYLVTGLWQDHLVFEDILSITSSETHELAYSVYYVDLHVVDADDVDLGGAQIAIESEAGYSMGTGSTDAQGVTTFRLPVGAFSIEVDWKDVLVAEDQLTVEQDDTIKVVCSVYYAAMHVVDSREVDLENAQVVVEFAATGTVMGSGTTDPDGRTTFRLPIGSFNVNVFWQDTRVLSDVVEVDQSGTIDLMAKVYYVTFNVVDSEGIDLVNAQVIARDAITNVALGTGITDVSGAAELRLPEDTGTVTVFWKSAMVSYKVGVDFEENGTVDIIAQVYYLTVEVKGSNGEAVVNADINIDRAGDVVASSPTMSDGATLFRLPVGNYTIKMTFRTTYYLTEIDVSKDKPVDLTDSMTIRFDLGEDDYPIPFTKTNLFAIIMAFIITVFLLLLLTYAVHRKGRIAKEMEEEEALWKEKEGVEEDEEADELEDEDLDEEDEEPEEAAEEEEPEVESSGDEEEGIDKMLSDMEEDADTEDSDEGKE
jgi:hypothetical protein